MAVEHKAPPHRANDRGQAPKGLIPMRIHPTATHLALILVALVLLALPTTALAANQYAPTAAQLEWSRSVAVAYWQTPQPPCGRESVALAPLAATIPAEVWGANPPCVITLNASYDWRDFPESVCHAYVHEFGHLVLGPDYFAAVNPSDPAHSTDPNSIMYGKSGGNETAQDLAVGCLPSPPVVIRSWAQPSGR